ncbi:MAG: oxidoreductase [Clostridiales bacterium]|nr:oxidoreductase [Clostridiales bacterium]
MRQVTGLTSTYSSDEFGICSALYELGGMVVMHDASGCNSTYTTHDEPRWYDMDSMIYISAISETEAILGDDDKLIDDLVETAQELHPEFIALVGAPIPYMIGTDLAAIARIVSRKTGIRSFAFAANGMRDYTVGVSMALDRIVKEYACMNPENRPTRFCSQIVNIIGATPLDFSLNGSVASIQRWITENGMKSGVCLSLGCTLDDVKRLGSAQVNLVVSAGGLAAARTLREHFGTPYVVGVPIGESFSALLEDMVCEAARSSENCISYNCIPCPGRQTTDDTEDDQRITEPSDAKPGIGSMIALGMTAAADAKSDAETGIGSGKMPDMGKRFAVIGESVFSASLAAAIEMEHGVKTDVLCPLEIGPELLRTQDLSAPEEDDLISALENYAGVIADPLYRPLVRDGQRFYPLPHEAFSGRIYDNVNPDLIVKKNREK